MWYCRKMEKLLEALQILLKYGNPDYPTHCEHDIMVICGIDPLDVSDNDKKKLDELGFSTGMPQGELCFYSYKYGSA